MQPLNIFGYRVWPFDSRGALARQVVNQPGVYVSLGAEALMRQDPAFMACVNSSIGYADGIGTVIAARWLCRTRLHKIPGCELWLDVLATAPPSRLAVWGGSPEVNAMTRTQLAAQYPQHQLVFCENGYTRDDDASIDAIVARQPEIVVLALGQPRQELIGSRIFERCPASRVLPVGGSLDVYTGKVKRAPDWLVRLHLEWAYRLWLEPSRIRRQLVLPKFLLRVVRATLARALGGSQL
ncbi:glycosyl transferase, WecB/TagA/CpsF family [Leptothrix cholodnii SP-6]|uniref:Glycosyl transferase, WecB/TagA/CpsF family n=1 Tax=Leptothrix cholodnii (strain ATCC 51168 / LMG 8142 / SP-6) TaxID=395495 RepID=B1XZR3_LEPCP|nr:WecB/TagA/CpsF family glycosyltransferase [Leptothrix cholodnii]ACB32909.1 glycosyl transferase, WecB/TagA/CpsF family [Leptothrix cholodnii SP-6]